MYKQRKRKRTTSNECAKAKKKPCNGMGQGTEASTNDAPVRWINFFVCEPITRKTWPLATGAPARAEK